MQARRTARIARRVDALAAASPRFLDSNKTSVLAEATSLLHATIARIAPDTTPSWRSRFVAAIRTRKCASGCDESLNFNQ